MATTKIEWADVVWNPITGCTPVSEGCRNCYAKRMAQRLRGRFGYPADEPFRVTFHKDKLYEPLRWRKPRRVFVCSMGDLFHPDVPPNYIHDIYEVMSAAKRHIFIVLTKRPERILKVLYDAEPFYFGGGDYLPNVWHLTSIENQQVAETRIRALLKLREASLGWPVLGVSCEPLLGPVDLEAWFCHYDKNGEPSGPRCKPNGKPIIDWVIVGGETGPGARKMNPEWVRDIRDQCIEADVPFFFKQWGGSDWEFAHFNIIDGRMWRQFPDV